MAQPALTNDWSISLAAAVERAAPGVVRVDSCCGVAGTGVVWNREGIILTSRRGLGSDEGIEVVTSAGEHHPASLLGSDAGTDVAVLRAERGDDLAALEFRDLDGVKTGHAVLALGRPGQVVRASLRIVGVLGPEYRTPAGGRLDEYLETDRRIPRGFSGGPLVDLEGRALGMNTRGLLRGADLAVPTATLTRVTDEIVAHGKIRRGHLGVGVYAARLSNQVREELSQESGAMIVAVEEASPAEAADLLLGDVIVAISGERVRGPRDLRAVLQDRANQEVSARIVRAGALEDLAVAVGERG